MRRCLTLLIGVVIVVSGCSRSSIPSATQRAAQEDDVREAVFRYQFEHNYSKQQQRAKVYFISIAVGDRATDPTNSFMSRFAKHKPPVKKVSDSVRSVEGVRDKVTGAQGLSFGVGHIKWISQTKVEVDGGYFEDGLAASGNVYTLEKKHGRWIVTKDKVTVVA